MIAVFAVSGLRAYLAGQGAGWSRVKAALGIAGLLLFVTMAIARYVVRLVPVGLERVGSIKVFVGIWLAVVAIWALAFAR